MAETVKKKMAIPCYEGNELDCTKAECPSRRVCMWSGERTDVEHVLDRVVGVMEGGRPTQGDKIGNG